MSHPDSLAMFITTAVSSDIVATVGSMSANAILASSRITPSFETAARSMRVQLRRR